VNVEVPAGVTRTLRLPSRSFAARRQPAERRPGAASGTPPTDRSLKLGDTAAAGEHAARAHFAARAAGEPLLLAAAARAAATPLRRTGRAHQALYLLLDARA
jgi:hypothetical protein